MRNHGGRRDFAFLQEGPGRQPLSSAPPRPPLMNQRKWELHTLKGVNAGNHGARRMSEDSSDLLLFSFFNRRGQIYTNPPTHRVHLLYSPPSRAISPQPGDACLWGGGV